MTLQAQGLTITRGGRQLFRSLALTVTPGDALRIAGGNGAGKTSLLRIVAGLLSPESGQVSWNGAPVSKQRDQFQAQMIYIGHQNGIKDDLTPCENLLFAASLAGRRIGADSAYQTLDQTGLGALADRPCKTLSQGQKRKVALARLQCSGAVPLWILDEPLTALDPEAQQQLTALLHRHLAGNGMLIYTTHQDLVLTTRSHAVIDLGRVP
jgi:heme exporter protein A